MAKKIEDMTPAEADAELKRLQIIEKKLILEDLGMRVENEKARRANIARAQEQTMRTLDEANKSIQASQKVCKHKKGGKNLEGILNGNDNYYSVLKNTYPWGDVEVICSRCGKEWKKPPIELKKAAREEYELQLAAYTEAINFPTDNEPSGTQLFLITGRKAS